MCCLTTLEIKSVYAETEKLHLKGSENRCEIHESLSSNIHSDYAFHLLLEVASLLKATSVRLAEGITVHTG